ncbi:YdeI/OmpD-associated family protein [Qipengyuania sediminis]|uniref:YdeI/OmpD-associated family protein n=1 Tax=Qipengyuania sediminis TaxID=1532023 RepID=UPI001059D9E1|nr:YdeI/OmpD-associated family protein [Qipengyuania sediminis]
MPNFPQGSVHTAAPDVEAAICAAPDTLNLWTSLTSIARNEFICWIEDAKKPATRARRIARIVESLSEGKRRPCCWSGCIHRTDRSPRGWQQGVLIDKRARPKP